MRPSLLVVLAAAAIVSATGTGCAQKSIEDLVTKTSCGCTKSITKCLRTVNLERLEEIEKCYIGGGCEESDAAVGAMWFAKECHEEVADEKDDLRRRADTTTDSTTDSTTASVKTTATTAKTTGATTAKTTAKTTTSPSSAAASTTTDSTTSDSTTLSTTASSTTGDSTTSSTTTASTTSATTNAITTGTLLCSVTSTVQTSMCFVSAGKTQSCIPTVTAIGSCAPGNICFPSSAATPATCMKKSNTLTTSGLIVTIAFATGIIATIIAVTVMQLKGRSKQRRIAQAALMAAGGSNGKGRATSDVESANAFSQGRRAQGMQSEANLPLIGAEQQQQYYNQQEYSAQGPAGGYPSAPRIHQGLGALGQESHY